MTNSEPQMNIKWKTFFNKLDKKEHLGRLNYANIKLLKPKGIMGDMLVIAAPNEAIRRKVEEKKIYTVIKQTVQEVFDGATPQIIIEKSTFNDDNFYSDLSIDRTIATDQSKESKLISGRLNPKYTFDNFIWGTSNRFAYSAAVSVAEEPATAYNPLFIYGRSGLGKTHLLHSIGHYALNEFKRKNIKVLYVSSEEYTNDFINSISNEKAKNSFKNRYRNVDILLIDDIQFLAKKDNTQEEFFHTFNALLDGSKQVVITSDVSPKELHSFEERLLTRFTEGLLVDVIPPNLETRIAILRHKLKLGNLKVPYDVIELIASKIDTNIRELEGALIRISAYADLMNVELTIDLTQNILKELLDRSDKSIIDVARIIEKTAEHFSLKKEDLCGDSRVRSIVFPRQVAMYLCREMISDLTLALIGKEFGKRDHTTVMHAVKNISKLVKTDRNFYDQIAVLTASIKG